MRDRRHVFVRRDGTTFVEAVPAGSQTVETYVDPELVALRELASDVTVYFTTRNVSDRARLLGTLDRVFNMTRGRYGIPKRRPVKL